MSAAATDGEDIISGINVTPLVDIMLVLLIVFMVTTTMMQYPSVPIELPRATHTSDTPAKNLQLSIDKENNVYVNGQKRSLDEVASVLKAEQRQNPKVAVVLAADASVRYQQVMTVIDMVKGAQITNFMLNTDFAAMTGAAQ